MPRITDPSTNIPKVIDLQDTSASPPPRAPDYRDVIFKTLLKSEGVLAAYTNFSQASGTYGRTLDEFAQGRRTESNYEDLLRLNDVAIQFQQALSEEERKNPGYEGRTDEELQTIKDMLPGSNKPLSKLLARLENACFLVQNRLEETQKEFTTSTLPLIACVTSYVAALQAQPLNDIGRGAHSHLLPSAPNSRPKSHSELHDKIQRLKNEERAATRRRTPESAAGNSQTGPRETPIASSSSQQNNIASTANSPAGGPPPDATRTDATNHGALKIKWFDLTDNKLRPEDLKDTELESVPLPGFSSRPLSGERVLDGGKPPVSFAHATRQRGELLTYQQARQQQIQLLPADHDYSQHFTDNHRGSTHEMTGAEKQRVDSILRKLSTVGERTFSGSLRRGFVANPNQQLDQLKELVGSSSLSERELREHVLKNLLDSIPDKRRDFERGPRGRTVRLYQRYIDPNNLDKNVNHSDVAKRARGDGGKIDQQRLVSDAALLSILPKLLEKLHEFNDGEDNTTIYAMVKNNLERLRDENPWVHALMIGKISETLRTCPNWAQTELRDQLLKEVKWMNQQFDNTLDD